MPEELKLGESVKRFFKAVAAKSNRNPVGDSIIGADPDGSGVQSKKFIQPAVDHPEPVRYLDIQHPCCGAFEGMQVDDPVGFKTGCDILGGFLFLQKGKQVVFLGMYAGNGRKQGCRQPEKLNGFHKRLIDQAGKFILDLFLKKDGQVIPDLAAQSLEKP